MSGLIDCQFTDLYLGQRVSWLSGVPGEVNPVAVPEKYSHELEELRRQCTEIAVSSKKTDFMVRCGGLAYRTSILGSINEDIYVLRRFPKDVPDVYSLGWHKDYVNRLLTPKLSGLIVISGAYGQGKTTTASSIVAARISRFGGIAVTIEDPPEMPLEGQHGKGVCYQTWVDNGCFGQACRLAARWAPSVIFLGEVRDADSATEALRASIIGRLIVCTTHADSVAMTIERLYSLATGGAGNAEDIASLLSSGLMAVAHQRLETDRNGVQHPKIRFLWLGDEDAIGVRNTIRQKRFNQVENEVDMQLNRLMSNVPPKF